MVNPFSSERLCVDIRGNVIKYMQARYEKTSGTISVEKYGNILFSYDLMNDGLIDDSDEAANIIRNFIKKEKITAKNVYLNISDPSILVRIVKVPKMSVRDIGDYLNMEISQYLPIDPERSFFDYKLLGSVTEEGKDMLNLLLISLPKRTVMNFISLFKKAGLIARVVDVYPNSIARVFGSQCSRNAMVVDLSQDVLDFVTFENGSLFMYSNVEIKNSLIFSGNENCDIKKMRQDNSLFEMSLHEIEGYISTYMDFFSARHFGDSVETLYILGEIAQIDNICSYLTQTFNIEVNHGLTGAFNIRTQRGAGADKRIAMYPCNLGLMLRID